MGYQLNDKVKGLKAYDAVTGSYKIRLDANESFIDPGQLMAEEIAQAIAHVPLNRYPDAGCKELRENFAALYNVSPEMVVAGNGSDELITVIMGALLMAGDKLLTFSPDFSMYQFYGHTYEIEGIVAEKDEDLILTADNAIAAIEKSKPQVVLFSNPCSPTSLVLPRKEIVRIIENAHCLVVVDEAYMEFSNESVMDLTDRYDNLIVLKTCSKALGCAAIRLGFAVSSKHIVDALNAVRSPYNVNAVTQAIGALILSKQAYVKESIGKIIASRESLYEMIIPLQGKNGVGNIVKPDTNFVFLPVKNAKIIYEKLLERSIIVRQLGDALRITAGTEEENLAVTAALFDILEVAR